MNYQSAKELKGIARDKMLGNYGTAIGAFLFLRFILFMGMMLTAGLSGGNSLIYVVTSFIFILIEGVFIFGELSIYLKISVGRECSIGDIFSGFKGNADKAIKARLIYVAILYGCLFAGAGIEYIFTALKITGGSTIMGICWIVVIAVAVYLLLVYSQVLYYLQDFSDITVIESCKRSRKLMDGNKLSLFFLVLSFVPLYIVGVLSFMVGLYYIHPYVKMTLTEFYLDRVRQNKEFDVSV